MGGAAFRFGDFELDTSLFELRSAGERVPLEPRAFDVLHYLIVHRDRVVSREELLDAVWGDRFVTEGAITTVLRSIRVAIGDVDRDNRLIRTAFRRGYQFVGPVTPIPAVAGPRADPAGALPARLTAGTGLGFSGRTHERVVLADVWKEVLASGQRRLVLISGEAGIGKTALCSVFAAATRHEAVVLYGRCDEELSVPYQPWRDALTTLDHDLPDVLAPRHEALAPLMGGAGAVDLESDSARFVLYNAMVDVLGAVAAGGKPVLLVLDDLHWADVQTLVLLRYLFERAPATPIMMIATFRDSDIDAGHPLSGLLAATHRQTGTTRLALRGLDDGEVLGFLETVAGHDLGGEGPALRDALRAETEGNPFFLTEIVRHLIETGAVTDHDGRWSTPAPLLHHGLPLSVREVVSRRAQRLGAETRRALDAASVIGREFELGLLGELLGEEPLRTYERLAPAVENALLVDAAGRFAFTHAIVAHTLYTELGPTARAFGHQAVAVALERRAGSDGGEGSGEIAYHWIRAVGPHHRVKAAEHAFRAGGYALTHLAPDDAAGWYRQTLGLLPEGPSRRRCEALVGLGTAQRQSGDAAYRETLLDAARLAVDLNLDDLLVRAALANNRGGASRLGAIDEERVLTLRRAIATRPPAADAALLRAILAIEIHIVAQNEAEVVVAHAMALAHETGDDVVLAQVARLSERALRPLNALDQRERILREGVAAAERTGDPWLRGLLSTSYHGIALERGDRDTMDRERDIRDTFAERSPEPFFTWVNLQSRSIGFFLDGDLGAAETAAETALQRGLAVGQNEALFGYAAQLFQIRRGQDRLTEVAESFEQVSAAHPALQIFRAGLAYLWCETGRTADARALAENLDVAPDGAPQFLSTAVMLWAEVCHRLALPDQAARLVPFLHDRRDQVATTGATTEGCVAYGLGHALATLGRSSEASEAFELALAVNSRLRAPLLVARTRIAYAELLAETDPDRARHLATAARTTAAESGFALVTRHAEQLLARLP
ncbi:AAA family ATPase [Actinoplanes sp. NPDC051851]|uniref:AAA family ATPase n=1 Tax=Actinoplanes sp. NPDC051851 TaxID=3154753 RepID=UPI0034218958